MVFGANQTPNLQVHFLAGRAEMPRSIEARPADEIESNHR